MATPVKQLRYQARYLIFPLIAYGFYILLLAIALLKQNKGNINISFEFLTFWGILIFLTSVLLSSFGFIHRKKLRQVLLIINTAVSLAIIVLAVSVLIVINKAQTANDACGDFVRCVIIPNGISH